MVRSFASRFRQESPKEGLRSYRLKRCEYNKEYNSLKTPNDKKLKFDHMNKWYLHNPESTLENETHKLLRDFEIQTDHLILTKRSDLAIAKKKKKKKMRTCQIVDFAVPAYDRVKLKESEKKDRYLGLAREQTPPQLWSMSDSNTDCNWCSWYSHQKIDKRNWRIWK